MAILGWPYRWNPIKEVTQLQQQLGELLSEREGPLGWLSRGRGYPAVNVVTTPRELVVTAQLPGVSRDDIDLTITENTIAIKGERRTPELPPDARYHRQERQAGAFVRAVQLPDNVDTEKAVARYVSGILTVTLPRVAETGPRRIALS
jgi:HSP20 family protein